jgi:DtxR family Mn-dependent transcriptional regulator
MEWYTESEENYLKALFHLEAEGPVPVSTNRLAAYLNTRAPSATAMLQKLAEKGLLTYEPYQGGALTAVGRQRALTTIRSHRLWEVFLVKHLGFGWEEVHDMAEQLEHIRHPELTQRLDQFLGFPEIDPHGDPIPRLDGSIPEVSRLTAADLQPGETGVLCGVASADPHFLIHLRQQGLELGTTLQRQPQVAPQGWLPFAVNHHTPLMLDPAAAARIFVALQ